MVLSNLEHSSSDTSGETIPFSIPGLDSLLVFLILLSTEFLVVARLFYSKHCGIDSDIFCQSCKGAKLLQITYDNVWRKQDERIHKKNFEKQAVNSFLLMESFSYRNFRFSCVLYCRLRFLNNDCIRNE